MSYILDALRKADAERERGNVPGINAQPTFAGHARTGAAPGTRPWVWIVIGVLGLLVVAAALWYLFSGNSTRGAAAMPVVLAPIVATPVIQPTPASVAPAVTVTAPVAVAPVAIAPAPVVTRRAPELASAPRKVPPTAVPEANVAAAPAPPAASAVGTRVYAVSELPDEIRRQLPNVTVGGSVYSSRPADRILIVNGQVLHEGEQIAPDLLLQQIRLKGALLNFKGYRYTIAF